MTTMTCRKCGNRVLAKEGFCPDCGVSFEPGRSPFLAGVLCLVIVACLGWVGWHLAFRDSEPHVVLLDDRREAWYAALQVCWEYLESPEEAEFPSYEETGTHVTLNEEGVFQVSGYVDLRNENGERERQLWEVTLSLEGDLWRAEYLRLGDREFSGSVAERETGGGNDLPLIEDGMAIYDVARRFARGLGGAYEAVVSSYADEGVRIVPVGPGEFDAYGILQIPERGAGQASWRGRVVSDSAGRLAVEWMDLQGFDQRFAPGGETVIPGLEQRLEAEPRRSVASTTPQERPERMFVRLTVGRNVQIVRDGETFIENLEAGSEVEVVERNDQILSIIYRDGQGEIPIYFTDWRE